MTRASHSELVMWATAVKSRDGNTCQWCGSTDDLHAHHIKPKSKHPDLALDEENGLTLCSDCHIKAHSEEPHIQRIMRARKLATPRNGGDPLPRRPRKRKRKKQVEPKRQKQAPIQIPPATPMTGPEFRSNLEAIGMKPVAFADWIGINRATVFRWLNDGPPLYGQRIVSLLVERKALADRLSSALQPS